MAASTSHLAVFVITMPNYYQYNTKSILLVEAARPNGFIMFADCLPGIIAGR
jgi:hypothetical protein